MARGRNLWTASEKLVWSAITFQNSRSVGGGEYCKLFFPEFWKACFWDPPKLSQVRNKLSQFKMEYLFQK